MRKERTGQSGYIHRKSKAIGIAVFAVIMALFFLMASSAYALTTGTITSTVGVNVRASASTSSKALGGLGYRAQITITGEVTGSDGYKWYKINYGGATGYVRSDNVRTSSSGGGGSSTSVPSDFRNRMKAAGFPERYHAGLYEVYKAHPNWTFKAVNTGLNWSDAVAKEGKLGVSLVESSKPDIQQSVAKGAYNLEKDQYVSFDSGVWVQASDETIAYYMDPRNFLNSTDIFQFMSNKFDGSTQTLEGVRELVSGTFLAGTEKNSGKSYSEIIYNAGKNNGVNPLVLASMILVEQGENGGGGCISGDIDDYEGLYNYLNIGAAKGGGSNAVINGLKYAKEEGWDTPEKSINGGAEIYASSYVNSNKYTLYLQRFNVLNGLNSVGSYQYMTSIYGAQFEGRHLAEGYGKYAGSSLTFEIPVYNGMPSSPCDLPYGSGNNVNYLKSLSVKDGKLTPEFDPYTYEYKVEVPKDADSAEISAKAYKDAKVSGTGTVSLKNGAKRVTIEVTSSSGKTRQYILTVGNGDFTGGITADTGRISGGTRFETAVNVAEELKKELGVTRFSNIVVAYSNEFADALSATALAADKNAPILVVNESTEDYIKSYIDKNLDESGTVYLIGGKAVITERFENSLSGYNVTRLAGNDRYETNLAVLNEMNLNGSGEIIIASGAKHADALSASATGKPVMLVGNGLSESQKDFLNSLGSRDYYVLGGTAAVSEGVFGQVDDAATGNLSRIYGSTRYETGVEIAEKFFGDADSIFIASGDDFPDGLAGGVLAHAKGSPILLVNKSSTDAAAAFVDEHLVSTVTAIGGTAVIPDSILNKVA